MRNALKIKTGNMNKIRIIGLIILIIGILVYYFFKTGFSIGIIIGIGIGLLVIGKIPFQKQQNKKLIKPELTKSQNFLIIRN